MIFCCNKLRSIIFPENLRFISEYAFKNNELRNIIFSKSIEAVGVDAFSENDLITLNMDTIILPDRLKNIDRYVL